MYLLIVVKEPTKTAKIGGKDPAKKNAKKAVLKSGSKFGIFFHCLYLKINICRSLTEQGSIFSDVTS